MKVKTTLTALCAISVCLQAISLHAEEPTATAGADIAKELSDPVASLISVPLQNNFDFGGGPNGNGFRYTLNFQPVVPFKVSDNWNLISRTIVPFVHQDNFIGTSTQDGLSDIVQSCFFTPAGTSPDALKWGAGPMLLLPTATDTRLGTEKFGIGPTAVVLKQSGGWTYGTLVNHLWSVAGNDSRQEISASQVQLFGSYRFKTLTTVGISTESGYDWENSQWTVPLAASVSQLVKIGKLPVSLQLGARYYAEKPNGAPDWGLRFSMTFVFPK